MTGIPRVTLSDTEWHALSDLEVTLESGSKYMLQARVGDTLRFVTDVIINTDGEGEPTELNDGQRGHDIKFKYAGDEIYVRATGLPCSFKIMGVS